MKWYWKLMVLIAAATLVFMIGGMVYLVRARYASNDYVTQLGLSFNAAMMVNAQETHTGEDKAVIADHQGRRAVIVPENYKALQSYLRRDCAMPLVSFVNREKALHISFCAENNLYVQGDQDGQGASLLFECGKKTFRMHVSGGDLWQKILDLSLDGWAQSPNLPL